MDPRQSPCGGTIKNVSKSSRSLHAQHSLSCLILYTAVNLLDSGLQASINEATTKGRRSCPTSSVTLCTMITSAIGNVWPDVYKTMMSMSDRFRCSMDIDELMAHHTGIGSNSRLHRFVDSELTIGTHGRSCTAQRGVGRANHLLSDYPFVVSTKQSCGCASGVLLTEHVAMAIRLVISMKQRTSTESTFNSDADQFLSTLQCGLCLEQDVHANYYTLRNPVQGSSSTEGLWPFEEQCLFISVAVITVLFLSQLNRVDLHTSDSISPVFCRKIAHGSRRLDVVTNNTWLAVNILSRLPTNTHAVSQLVSTAACAKSSGEAVSAGIVEQRILGYGTYLHASCVNHACAPNATIKFSLTQANQPGKAAVVDGTTAAGWELLTAARLDVVALESISAHHEITVSYGVLAGRDRLNVRRSVLNKQYLFHCTCAACTREECSIGSAEEEYTTAHLHKRWISEENAMQLLEELRSQLTVLNVEFSEILNLSRSAKSKAVGNTMLQKLYSERVRPFLDEVMGARTLFFGFPHEDINKYITQGREDELQDYLDMIPKPPSGQKREQVFTFELFKGWCTVYCCVLDMHAHLAALLSSYDEAANAVREAIFHLLHSHTYVDEDIAVARERTKLAGLLVSCGRIAEAKPIVSKAVDVLDGIVPETDPDYLEAVQIYQFTQRR
jgi:hypothetical protein